MKKTPKERKRLLIVDDDGRILDLIQESLRPLGMEISTARDGETALELLKKGISDAEKKAVSLSSIAVRSRTIMLREASLRR